MSSIEDKIYECEGNFPLKKDQIEEIVDRIRKTQCPGEAELDSVRQVLSDRSRLLRRPVDNCVEIFLRKTGIKPDLFPLDGVSVHCKHITSVIDRGESIKKHGLLRLDEVLMLDTPLRRFLAEKEIEIKPRDNTIIIQGQPYPISQRNHSGVFGILSTKLYHDHGEIEVFLNSEYEDMVNYSCISRCPEILNTLDRVLEWNLQNSWVKKRTDLLMVDFDVCLSDINIFLMDGMNSEFYSFLSCEYEEIPLIARQNWWIIRRCLNNGSKNIDASQEYGAIKPGVKIEAESIRITNISV